jgi:hypothetical protein
MAGAAALAFYLGFTEYLDKIQKKEKELESNA